MIQVLCCSVGIISLIDILCIGYHCWERQSTPNTCPYCERKLGQSDKCGHCGAIRINLGGKYG